MSCWACVSESGAGRAIGHAHADDVLRAERARGERRDHGGIDAARRCRRRPSRKPRRLNSSLRKLTSQDSTRAGSISSGGGAPRERSPPATTSSDEGSVAAGRMPPAGGFTVFGPRSSVFGLSPSNDRSSSDFSFGSIVRMSDSSGESARALVMSSRSTLAVSSASSNAGACARVSPLGPIDERAALEHAPALAAHETRERDVHAVLLGDVADQPVPARHARRNRDAVGALERAARRRRGRHEHHVRAVERRDQPRERMPRILADQHGRAAPRRVERADGVAALDEPLLVEQAVRREEVLPVHVQDLRRAAAAHVREAVVQVAFELLVESDHRVDRRAAVRRGESGGELAGGQRHLANAALDEVAGERRLGKLHHVRARIERGRLREHLAYPAEVALNVPLPWPELGDGDVQERHRSKARTVDR